MTELQAIHHIEQMEAQRRDFHIFWNEVMVPCLLDCGWSMVEIQAEQPQVWKAWLRDGWAKHGLAKAARGVTP